MKIDDPANPGTEIEVLTPAEVDAKLKEKDDHVAKKLEEFQKGKTAQELATEASKAEIGEAKKVAEEAKALAESTIASSRKKVVDFLAEQFVGADEALNKKLKDAFEIVEAGRIAKGMDVKDDKSIQEMMISAAGMAGIPNTAASMPSFPLSGGYTPRPSASETEVSEGDNNTFLDAVGYQKPPAPKQN